MSDDVTSRVCHDLRPTESEESDESTSRADFRAGACLTSPRVYRPVTSSYSLLTHLLTALQERSTHVMSTEKKSIKKIYDQTRRLFREKEEDYAAYVRGIPQHSLITGVSATWARSVAVTQAAIRPAPKPS